MVRLAFPFGKIAATELLRNCGATAERPCIRMVWKSDKPIQKILLAG
jgi:hypothetical protein